MVGARSRPTAVLPPVLAADGGDAHVRPALRVSVGGRSICLAAADLRPGEVAPTAAQLPRYCRLVVVSVSLWRRRRRAGWPRMYLLIYPAVVRVPASVPSSSASSSRSVWYWARASAGRRTACIALHPHRGERLRGNGRCSTARSLQWVRRPRPPCRLQLARAQATVVSSAALRHACRSVRPISRPGTTGYAPPPKPSSSRINNSLLIRALRRSCLSDQSPVPQHSRSTRSRRSGGYRHPAYLHSNRLARPSRPVLKLCRTRVIQHGRCAGLRRGLIHTLRSIIFSMVTGLSGGGGVTPARPTAIAAASPCLPSPDSPTCISHRPAPQLHWCVVSLNPLIASPPTPFPPRPAASGFELSWMVVSI